MTAWLAGLTPTERGGLVLVALVAVAILWDWAVPSGRGRGRTSNREVH